MTYFLGYQGKIRLRRTGKESFASSINNADITTSLNRAGLSGAADNLITGDQITIKTTAAQGLAFFVPSTWSNNTIQDEIDAYVNVNPLGALRFFSTYAQAINNQRAYEFTLQNFAGDPIPVTVSTKAATDRILGDVVSYTFNTDREAIDTTTLSDKYRNMYSAGIISGSGSMDCLFNPIASGYDEISLVMLQLIQRLDLGSDFEAYLLLTDTESDANAPTVFYEFGAMITKAGIEVSADSVIKVAVDFVTTGEIKLLIGKPSGYILKEDTDKLLQESLDGLLTEVED